MDVRNGVFHSSRFDFHAKILLLYNGKILLQLMAQYIQQIFIMFHVEHNCYKSPDLSSKHRNQGICLLGFY